MKTLLIFLAILLLATCLAAYPYKFLTTTAKIEQKNVQGIRLFENYIFVYTTNDIYVYSVYNKLNPRLETAFHSQFAITDLVPLDITHFFVCSTDPTNRITEIDSLNMHGKIFQVNKLDCNRAIRESSLLYTADLNKGLEIYDLGKGVAPFKLSTFSQKWGIIDFIAAYPRIHALNAYGYVCLDVTDTANPQTLGTNYEVSNGKIIVYNRKYVWIGAGSTLYALDVSNPSSPRIVNRYRFASAINTLYAREDELFVGLNSSGLHILNIANPRKITEKNSTAAFTMIKDIVADGDTIYVVSKDSWWILSYR